MLDGVLKEVCDRCGGATALARELGISKQAVFKWRVDGFPEERIRQIEKLTGIPRGELRNYSAGKARAKRRGLDWWEPTSLGPRPQSAERYDRTPSAKPPPPPFRPVPPVAFGFFTLLNAAGHLPRNRHLLMMFARTLYDSKPYYLYPKGPPVTKRLLDIGVGCWLNPALLGDYRTIAKCFGATGQSVDTAIVFFPQDREAALTEPAAVTSP